MVFLWCRFCGCCKKTIDQYGKNNNVIIVNNPIANEHEDNIRFLHDVEKWINQKIVYAKNSNFQSADITEVFEKFKYMSGTKGARCTKELKKEARYQYEKSINIDYHVLGFTFDEKNRHEKFIKFERDNVLPILIDWSYTKEDCFKLVQSAGIDIPYIYKLGYPNANCIGCVKSQSPTYWNLVRKTFPEIFKQRAEQSRKIGCKLVKYKKKRIYLDELPADAKGGKIKSWECGIFCDTK